MQLLLNTLVDTTVAYSLYLLILSHTAPVGLAKPTDIGVDLPIHAEHFDLRLIR